MEMKIEEGYFKSLLDTKARSIVGRTLKRIETIKDDKILKEEIKNLLYEEFRDIYTLLKAYHDGSLFSLKRKEPTE